MYPGAPMQLECSPEPEMDCARVGERAEMLNLAQRFRTTVTSTMVTEHGSEETKGMPSAEASP